MEDAELPLKADARLCFAHKLQHIWVDARFYTRDLISRDLRLVSQHPHGIDRGVAYDSARVRLEAVLAQLPLFAEASGCTIRVYASRQRRPIPAPSLESGIGAHPAAAGQE